METGSLSRNTGSSEKFHCRLGFGYLRGCVRSDGQRPEKARKKEPLDDPRGSRARPGEEEGGESGLITGRIACLALEIGGGSVARSRRGANLRLDLARRARQI